MDYRERWELKDYLIGQVLERRIVLLQAGLIVMMLAFLLNFWYLQGVRGEIFAELAENNRLRRIPVPATRGVVFDGRQEVIAATRPSLDLILWRDDAADVDAELRRLAPILDMSYEELLEKMDRARHRPQYEPLVLKEDVSLEELARIEARRELFPTVEVQQTARRSYPHADMFGHVLGYVGEASETEMARYAGALQLGDIVGKTGVELVYDDQLRGLGGWNLVVVNNLGRRIHAGGGGEWVGQEPHHGQPLGLTLDLRLQRALREGLGEEAGAGVFMDPWTGEILAMASTPAYDPTVFANGVTRGAWEEITGDPGRPLHDRAIASYYAPGSTFKVLMSVAGLESGTVTPQDTAYCSGSAVIYGSRRLCWKRGGHGTVDLRKALTHSCNVYFYQLGQRIGIDSIHKYGEMFNLGRTTGIDLPGEVSGILPSRAWKLERMRERWYPGDTISISIGQGLLAVTPVQMATMISAVATEGWLSRPHLVKGRDEEPVQLRIRPETFEIVRQALHDAVERGTGGRAKLKDVSVAGKTGTAQVYKHSAGIDSDKLPKSERDHAWFVGYAPADRPRIAFAVVIEHGGHGGATAAPVARAVLEVFFSEETEAEQAPDGQRADGSRSEQESHAGPALAG